MSDELSRERTGITKYMLGSRWLTESMLESRWPEEVLLPTEIQMPEGHPGIPPTVRWWLEQLEEGEVALIHRVAQDRWRFLGKVPLGKEGGS